MSAKPARRDELSLERVLPAELGRLETRSPKKLRHHPEAGRIPAMKRDEAGALEAAVAVEGILVPLDVTPEGVVLDGHQRLRLALSLGFEWVPVRVIDPPDQVEYMYSVAGVRRHFTPSQLAAIAIERDEYRVDRATAELRKRANLRNSGLDVADLPLREGRTRDHAARLAGVSPTTIQKVITVRKTDPDLYAQIRSGDLAADRAVKELQRRARYAAIAEAPPLPTGLFDLIYADPAWQMGSWGTSGSPEQHYPTMPTSEIAALKVRAAQNAVLFLWVPTSLLPDGLEVMDAWGFTYKSSFFWIKPSIGPGNYLRNRHEQLLIGIRGTYSTPFEEDRCDSVVEAPRGRHSEKPKIFYELIEQIYPHAQRRLELFARGKTRKGWTFWGNEVIE